MTCGTFIWQEKVKRFCDYSDRAFKTQLHVIKFSPSVGSDRVKNMKHPLKHCYTAKALKDSSLPFFKHKQMIDHTLCNSLCTLMVPLTMNFRTCLCVCHSEWTKTVPWPSTGMSGGTTSCSTLSATWRRWHATGSAQWWGHAHSWTAWCISK